MAAKVALRERSELESRAETVSIDSDAVGLMKGFALGGPGFRNELMSMC